MSTRSALSGVSVRRNRDYSSHFVWNEELNRDLYEFYVESRSNPAPGYMQRLKDLWDKKYPMYSSLNKKQLRQQATFVEKRIRRQHSSDAAQNQQDIPSNTDNLGNKNNNKSCNARKNSATKSLNSNAEFSNAPKLEPLSLDIANLQTCKL